MDDPRTAQLEVLNEVARIATLDVELRPMLQRITDTLARKFNWEFVALVTIDHERDAFVCDAVTSSFETEIHVGYMRPLGSGVVGHVAATGEPVIVNDVHAFPNYVETMRGAESEICVPVLHHGRTVAVLNLESRRKAAFPDQLPLLKTVADQISGAIANAQIVAELRQRASLMEMMSEVSRTALEATDLRELLDRIARYIQERFLLEFTAIVMHDATAGELVHAADAGNVGHGHAERWSIERGVVGLCVRSGRTLLIPDVSLEPSYIPLNPGVKSELVVPIRFQGQVLGALNLESSSPDVFGPANVLAFEAFAVQVAGAIHMASVNDRLAETTRLLELKTSALEEANEHLAGAIETLHRISTQDGLTGVSNRRHFDDTLAAEWRRATRKASPLALLILDIDYFKAFNDSAGHQAGDDCLRRVAQTLQESVHRAADLVARYGGEEFAVLLPDTDFESAHSIAEALRQRVEELGLVTTSIGVASGVPPLDGSGVEELVGRADAALYEAKRAGRNKVV
jgi:diguanylate cyclase (GGDEF)-like protein